MSETADVVVAGAGHNSLITAAYLAKAGYEVVVLDARAEAGGGAASEELLLPGYLIDSCSTGHTLIQPNPVLRDDELGLKADYGLEYVSPDPVAHVVFPDGASFTHWLDLERTCAELARFSSRDADTYRRLLREFDEIRPAVAAYRFNPVGYAPSLRDAVSPKWQRRLMLSAHDVVTYEYEDPHVQAYMLWQSFQTLQPVDAYGTGLNAVSILAGRQSQSWILPVGGSGELPRALVRCIEDNGGRVITRKLVSGLVVEGGRCTGVETVEGERYLARLAVLSSVHVKSLVTMAPAELWGDDFLYGIDTFDPGISVAAQYYVTTEAPRFVAHDGEREAVSAGLVGWPDDVVQAARDTKAGRLQFGKWLLCGTPTIVDPSRAPNGHHTLKVLTPQPWAPDGDPANWTARNAELEERNFGLLSQIAPNMTRDKVLAHLSKTPVDIERANPHMWHGTIHGGDRGIAFDGPNRPAPGWAQHRMPIPGLYQTGATTHPGGSITGAPGRNAAVIMLEDLGRDPREVMRPFAEATA
ncbi:MAG TPA: NAD(P)/FAD-dependent oxidoreductase [Gaiellaceae bacterium]|nr:NAD(P)/FAD-dependent oxidoreductase [Gaiellaceae bacterium]